MAQEQVVIESVADLTVDFLQKALQLENNLESFTTTRIGTGQMAECHRVQLSYSSSSPDPPSLLQTAILKIASQDPRSRSTARSIGIYEQEVRFYRDLSPALEGKGVIGKCYHSAFDGNRDSGAAFTLLLEDSGPPPLSAVGDDIRGGSKEQAVVAMRALGRIQGGLMGELEGGGEGKGKSASSSWLIKDKPLLSPEMFRHLFGSFEERYRDRLTPEHFHVCERIVGSYAGYAGLLENKVVGRGVIHGDYRLDNMLFRRLRREGDGDGALEVVVVDWQCVTAGHLLGDVAYFLGGSLLPLDRREWQDELLVEYCRSLEEAAGKKVLTIAECREDLRLSSFFGVIMCITSSILAGQTERGDDMFMTTLTRHCEQVLDLEAVDLLPEPVVEDMTPIRPPPEMEQRHDFGQEKDWNESWYFDFVDKEQGVAGWVRMGLVPNHNDGTAWYHATLTRNGKPTIIVSDFTAPLPDADLHLKTANIDATHQVVKPLETFHLTLNGKGYILNPEDEGFFNDTINSSITTTLPPLTTDLELALTFESDGAPYKYRITTRYEIPCRVSGTVKTTARGDGSTTTPVTDNFSISQVPGQRDHSYGVRDWWSMDWVWNSFHTTAVDGSKQQKHFHATDLRLANTPRIGMGYVQILKQGQRESDEIDGEMAIAALEIDKLTCEETKDPKTRLVTDMKITIKTHSCGSGDASLEGGEGGDTVVVRVTPRGHTPLTLPSPDGRISLFDRAWGEVEVVNTGEKGVGWFEWNCALGL